MPSIEDQVVLAVHSRYDQLPQKSKPRDLNEKRVAEWVPLSGIAICKDYLDNGPVQCVALGTGMKCLPSSKVASAKGNVLHDWHAETLAIRAFNRFLLDECHRSFSSPAPSLSEILRQRSDAEISASGGKQPFTIRHGLRVFMYCSEAPCGDASMEVVMGRQEDATPWPITDREDDGDGELLGRGSFGELGVVRRKPSRPDSPATLSKSCSDKLAMKQCTSLLSGLVALMIHPENVYLDTLILPRTQHIPEACERAWGAGGRMRSLDRRKCDDGYSFRPFRVCATDLEFRFSRDQAQRRSESVKGSNVSAVWTSDVSETLVKGVLQGRKQDDPKGASLLSRKMMAQSSCKLNVIGPEPLGMAFQAQVYMDFKLCKASDARRHVKAVVAQEALKGWVKNVENSFEIDPTESHNLVP